MERVVLRIQDIDISNFRGISRFQAQDLTDFVVIAGPNGCGKSCVLDAIRLVKSLYGGYSRNEVEQWFGEFQIAPRNADFTKLFRDKKRDLEIKIGIELHASEVDYLRKNAEKVLSPILWQELLNQDLEIDQLVTHFSAIMDSRRKEFDTQLALIAAHFRRELAQGSFEARVRIPTGGEIEVDPSVVLRAVFRTYVPRHLGIIDYHSAGRVYDREALGGVNLNLDEVTKQRKQFSLYGYREKYKNVKSELAAHYVRSVVASKASQSKVRSEDLNDTLAKLFQTFFPDKTYAGPEAQEDGSLHFPVRLASGVMHDIDDLSSGEKELLYGYLRLRNSSPRNSIILLDEPELHLNPRMLQGLPDFYHEHLGEALGSQLWLVTHSDALLRQVVGNSAFSTYHMTSAAGAVSSRQKPDENQANAINATEELDRAVVDIIGDLAVYKPRAKVVIVEGGGDTEVDVQIISRLFPSFAREVNLVSGGNKRRVRDLFGLLDGAAERAQMSTRFFAITDRDRELAKVQTANLYAWDRYHIENYLLEPKYIAAAMRGLLPKAPSVKFVEKELAAVARDLVDDLVAEELLETVHGRLSSQLRLGANSGDESPGVALRPSIAASVSRFAKAGSEILGDDWLTEQEHIIRSRLSSAAGSDGWKVDFPGRKILRRFVGKHLGGVPYGSFQWSVVEKMSEDGFRSPGMEKVVSSILSK